jgi:uncharacterized phage infection (PIP) family protein YhgE
MEDNMTVPYIVHESAMARNERHIKRLVIALIVSIVMLVLSNLAWLYIWNSYEYVGDSSQVTVDSNTGDANYIGDDGDIINGESDGKKGNSVSEEKER